MNLYIPYIYTIWVWWKMPHDLKSNSPNLPKLNGFGQVSWRNPWSWACLQPLGPLPPRPLVVASQGRSGCSLRRLDFWTSGWKFGKKMGKQKGKNGPKLNEDISRKHDGFSAANICGSKHVGPLEKRITGILASRSHSVCGYPILTHLVSYPYGTMLWNCSGTPLLKLPSGKLTFCELEWITIYYG